VIGSRELRTIVWLLLVFSILGLVLSGFLVANTVAAVVHDEFRQIGLLKALGGTRPRIVAVYLAPALILGGIGTVLGYLLGLAGGQAIVAFLTRLIGYPLPSLAITPREIGLALAVGLGVPVVAAVAPAIIGARLPVVRLLQSYGLAAPRRGRSGGILPRIVGRRSPLSAMAIRNTLRRRLRAGITTALIAIAVAAAIASQGLSSSLEGTIDTLYDRYGADAWIPFAVPVDDSLAETVAREPGVAVAEPWTRATGYARGRSIDLWGVPPATAIYDYRLIAGEWLREGDPRSIVVSANLARRLDLAPGETLALDFGEETRELTIIGVVDDESTYLGSTDAGKIFLAPRALDGIGGGRAFGFLAVQFERHDPASVEAAIARLEDRFADLHPQPYAAYTDKESTARSVNVLVVLLRAMVVLVALTGLVGVVNTQAMNVAERRREVGVVRALGAGRRHVTTLLIGEGLVLGLFGFTLGLIAGYPLARLLVRLTGDVLFRLSFSLPAPFLVFLLLATLAGCAAASVGPALLAARVRPTEVLRYE
jgi:putative ABC transport system permease protein